MKSPNENIWIQSTKSDSEQKKNKHYPLHEPARTLIRERHKRRHKLRFRERKQRLHLVRMYRKLLHLLLLLRVGVPSTERYVLHGDIQLGHHHHLDTMVGGRRCLWCLWKYLCLSFWD